MGKWLQGISTGLFVNLLTSVTVALLGVVTPLLIPWVRNLPTGWKILVVSGTALSFISVFQFIQWCREPPNVSVEPFVGAPEELKVNLNRLAQGSFQRGEHLFVDRMHHYSHISAMYEVEGFDGHYSVSYAGENVLRKPSRSVVRMIAGDSAIDRGVLALTISPMPPTESLTWDFVDEKETPYRKPFRVFFRSPLAKGDPFGFRLSCNWRGTFARKDDYVFWPVHQFRRGIDVQELMVLLPVCPVRYEGVIWRRGRYKVAETQPVLQEVERGWCIKATLQKPRHLYAIWFTRGDI